MSYLVLVAPARLVGALLLQVAVEYGAGAAAAGGASSGTGYDGAFHGVSMTEVRQLWDANVPFPPWVAGAGVVVLWGLTRSTKASTGGTARTAPTGGVSNGVVFAVGLLVLYVLARLNGVL